MAPLEKGTTIAGYRIEGVLGQGGMGVVYEATQLSLNRTVALKLLAGQLGDDPAFRERFRREGLLQAQIDHPNIVTVYEAGDTDEGLFLAMRLVRGPNLKDMIVARELDAGRSLRILTPVSEALDAAHAEGLIHRDIKPQNILVSGRDHAYLADFGLTKAPGEKSLTKTGQFVGTLDYISPEQIRGQSASKQSDIYALAAVLYECLSGVVPYPKDSEAAVLYAHMSDEPPSLTEARPDLPGALDDVIRKAMSKNPEERHQSASELLRDAEEAFSRKTRAAMSTPPPLEAPEETGIRASETDVGTREARAQDSDELATQVGGADATNVAAGGDATRVGGVDATRAAGPGTEGTQVAGAGGATVAAGAAAGATRMGASPDAAATSPLPVTGPTAGQGGAVRAPGKVSGGIIAAIAAAVIALAVVGYVVGSSGSSGKEAPANNSSASAGSLTITFPDTWQKVDSAPPIPGLTFKDPISVAPKGGPAVGALTAGTVSAADPTLLPATFKKQLTGGPPKGEPVQLGNLKAYRYTGLKPKNYPQELTVYTVPTDSGVATVACSASAAQASTFLPECERAASTLTLSGTKATDLGIPASYVKALNGAIKQMQTKRTAALKKLKSAKTPGAQASAARQAAAAYAGAAKSLAGGNTPPQVAAINTAVLAALRQGAAGYTQMASGAASNKSGRYKAGAGEVKRADKALQQALKALGQSS
ncbi:MAG: serine/threonine kinase PknH [Thermoleophilaceae bacterium]|nr:serine/threonine kinase PknH [Thermoleophilaceae bacterium]